MHVAGSLEKCIRVILHVNTPKLQSEMQHVYLQGAKNLRPDWQISPVTINR
jgi:chorismate mutase